MTHKRWSEEEIHYLIEHYQTESILQIACDLKRTKDSVFKKAKRLGLTSELKYWKNKEIDFVLENWGKKPVSLLAKNLNRSIVSIRKKAMELHLGPERIANGEFLTTGDIGYLLNKHPSLIYRWIKEGFIKGRRFGKKKIFQIRPYQFIAFLKEYPDKWCSEKARLNLIKPYFKDSKRSNVPIWFLDKVQKDRYSKVI